MNQAYTANLLTLTSRPTTPRPPALRCDTHPDRPAVWRAWNGKATVNQCAECKKGN